FMCYGDQVANVPNKLKKDVVPRKTRSLTIAEEEIVDLKVQLKKQAVAGEGSSVSHNKHYPDSYTDSDATLYSSSLDESKEGANETNDANESDMDLCDDNLNIDDDDNARYGVFMHNKSITTPNSTYVSLTVTSSSLRFTQTLLDETPVNELMDFMSHTLYTDAQTTSVVHNLEGNPKLTSYISGASEVPLGATKRKTTWFDLLLKSDINKNENHILRPSTVAIAKKLKAIIQKDELTIADLKGAGLKRLKQQYQNDVEFEYHVSQLKEAVLTKVKWNSDEDDVLKPRSFERHISKNTKPHPSFYNNDFYYLVNLSTEEKYTTSITKHYAARYHIQGIEDMIPDRWFKETHHYIFEALNGIHHWDGDKLTSSKKK
ncbi:hypothetical protein Tco_1280687, partial [Tanacetum coccineum]